MSDEKRPPETCPGCGGHLQYEQIKGELWNYSCGRLWESGRWFPPPPHCLTRQLAQRDAEIAALKAIGAKQDRALGSLDTSAPGIDG